MTPESEWIWHGVAGHFIGANRCCFRLHTQIGRNRVSTVGCWHPRHAGYDDIPTEIGHGRLYETMVFTLDEHGEIEEYVETGSDAYNDAASAERGHMGMCSRVASGEYGWNS